MKITIEICSGPMDRHNVSKSDIQKNIDAQQRAMTKASAADFNLLNDTLSILKGIKEQLP